MAEYGLQQNPVSPHPRSSRVGGLLVDGLGDEQQATSCIHLDDHSH